MNDDLQALRILLARAEQQRNEALAEQLKLEAGRRAADAQAEQLVVYRREYEARWSAEFCREGKIELVRCYQGFMARLSQAVEQQLRVARQAGHEAERAAALVQGHEVRAAALAKLLDRRLREGQRHAALLEQKESDESASRAAWSRLAVSGGSAGAPWIQPR